MNLCHLVIPKEFREDVVKIALDRGPEVTLAQIAKDFGIHVGTLDKWLREERIEQGQKPGVTRSENAELRELRKRNKLLEQEVEVLRRAAAYLSQAHLPGKGSTRSQNSSPTTGSPSLCRAGY